MTSFDARGHHLTEVEPDVWELARDDEMRVPARVLASEALLEQIGGDKTLDQLRNVACMPGVVAPALCMPDGHQGYGFPVGGVAAFDAEDGCISPAGIGFDINCGVRMVKTNLTYDDVRGHEEELVDALFDAVPCGLGGGGVHDGNHTDLDEALERGVDWCVEAGYAVREDRLHCEDEGQRPDADLDAVSKKARDRGASQMGSLGSGNHFLEVQRVTDVHDDETADAFGLAEDQIVVLIHCGSRGLGHQVCSDYLRRIEQEHPDFLESLPDKDLAAAPAGSELAEEYYGAMCAAINFAWVNRQLITHAVRETFADVFDAPDWEALEMDLLYDVAHNIAKRETHEVVAGEDDDGGYSLYGDGERVDRELFVHRKGATRAFPAGHPDVPAAYREVGQPVIIPGSMGAGSYVLKGGDGSLGRSFGSTAHGAGRLMSRTQAKDEYWGGDVQDDLREDSDIYVKAASGATIAEEAPGVYKDVDDVVGVSDALGIGDLVVRTYPVCNVKG
ncbi:RtcB family protein [Halobacterium rubrum]|uniref:RtcB family protein n=1 Tax=Halobacterium TaxID=2239 RepID=UPI001F2B944B|nr:MULTISPECIES: RtcB family protein [Halobacterium]MDH5019747.1 RtcB family protein [Halobacterium rubrum]